jgi:hypothetical protein
VDSQAAKRPLSRETQVRMPDGNVYALQQDGFANSPE